MLQSLSTICDPSGATCRLLTVVRVDRRISNWSNRIPDATPPRYPSNCQENDSERGGSDKRTISDLALVIGVAASESFEFRCPPGVLTSSLATSTDASVRNRSNSLIDGQAIDGGQGRRSSLTGGDGGVQPSGSGEASEASDLGEAGTAEAVAVGGAAKTAGPTGESSTEAIAASAEATVEASSEPTMPSDEAITEPMPSAKSTAETPTEETAVTAEAKVEAPTEATADATIPATPEAFEEAETKAAAPCAEASAEVPNDSTAAATIPATAEAFREAEATAEAPAYNAKVKSPARSCGGSSGGSSCCKRKKVSVLETESDGPPEPLLETHSSDLSPGAAKLNEQLLQQYQASLAPAIRLHRTIVDPLEAPLDMRQVRRNFHLVKLHRHPMQTMEAIRRLEDAGVSRLEQLLKQRLIQQYKASLDGQTSAANGKPLPEPVYPDWLTFKLRLKKRSGDDQWHQFVARKQTERAAGLRGLESRPEVKTGQKYSAKYIDVWTNSLTVLVRSTAKLADILHAAFVKLGLAWRTDFRYTLGCFLGDRRESDNNKAGGDSVRRRGPKVPIEVFDGTPVLELYHQHADEIFLNTNKAELYKLFPDFFDEPASVLMDFDEPDPQPVVRKKGRCC